MNEKERREAENERIRKRKEYYRNYQKAYLRDRKNALKAKGICPNCEKNPAAKGRVCCSQCLEDKKLTALFGTAGPYRYLYAELFEKQRGLCGICNQPMKRPLLDHCHKTMNVRGLLCSNCNIGLGQFKDDPVLLEKAMLYARDNAGIGIKLKKRSKT